VLADDKLWQVGWLVAWLLACELGCMAGCLSHIGWLIAKVNKPINTSSKSIHKTQ
jgi:hypothetical protein